MDAPARVPEMALEAVVPCVDYYAAYWNECDAHAFPEADIIKFIKEEVEDGNDEYAGYAGGIEWWGSSGTALGIRGGERYLRTSGGRADSRWRVLHRAPTHVQRIDPACTIRLGEARPGLARRVFQHHETLPKAFGQPRKCELRATNGYGDTFYLGSRQSSTYLRLYDFGAKHGSDAVGCSWRYEAELKGEGAKRALPLLLNDITYELATAGLVRALFSDRRISVPWTIEAVRGEIAARPRTSLERKLDWLEGQVAPNVDRLISLGYIEEVVKRLGLSGHVSINPYGGQQQCR